MHLDHVFDVSDEQAHACIEALLRLGADAAAADRSGHTPLHHAAAAGFDRCCELLISRGAAVSAGTKKGRTPLHEAASSGRAGALRVLLSAGADCGAQSSMGGAPLHCAAESRSAECVRVLLSAPGADPSVRMDGYGETPLHVACEQTQNDAVILALLGGGAQIDARLTRRRAGRPLSGDSLLLTPLMVAVSHGDAQAALLLLAHGADAHADCTCPDDPAAQPSAVRTPLRLACWRHPGLAAAMLLQGSVALPEADIVLRSGDTTASLVRVTLVLAERTVAALRDNAAAAAAANELEKKVDQNCCRCFHPVWRLQVLQRMGPPAAGDYGLDAAALSALAEGANNAARGTSGVPPLARQLLDRATRAEVLYLLAKEAEPEAAQQSICALQQWRAASSSTAPGGGAGPGSSGKARDKHAYAAVMCVARWGEVKAALREARRGYAEARREVALALQRAEQLVTELRAKRAAAEAAAGLQ